MVLPLKTYFNDSKKKKIKPSTLFPRVFKNMCVLVAQTCLPLCDPMDFSPPGSSVHGIIQAKILEWVAIPFSEGISGSRNRTQVSCIADRFFTV